MARNGKGGVALITTTIASFMSGIVGVVLMVILSPILAKIAAMADVGC